MPRLVLDEPIQAAVNKTPRLVLDEEPIVAPVKSPKLVPDNETEIRALTPAIKEQYPLELKLDERGEIKKPSFLGKLVRGQLRNAPIEEFKRASTLRSLPEDQPYEKGAKLYETIKEQEPVIDQLGNIITASLGVGAAAAPLKVAKGVAEFMAIKEAAQRTVLPAAKMGIQALSGDKVKYQVTELKDLVPEELRDVADLSEFVIYGAGAKKFNDILKNPKVAAELAGARFRILKTLGVKQETGLVPLTEAQLKEAFGENAAKYSDKLYKEAVESSRGTAEYRAAEEANFQRLQKVREQARLEREGKSPKLVPDVAVVGPGKATVTPGETNFRAVLTKRGISVPDNLEVTYVTIDNPSDPNAKAIVTIRPRSLDSESTASGDRFNIEIAPGEDAVTLYNQVAKDLGRKQLSTPTEGKVVESKVYDAKLEEPISNAVDIIGANESTTSSGFHEKFSKEFNGIKPSWAIIFKGKLSDKVRIAAEQSGLKINEREVYKGAVKNVGDYGLINDVYLPNVKQSEIGKAKEVFDKFAENYYKLSTPIEGKVTNKESIKAITDKITSGELSLEEANKQLEQYGVKVGDIKSPLKPKAAKKMADLADEANFPISTGDEVKIPVSGGELVSGEVISYDEGNDRYKIKFTSARKGQDKFIGTEVNVTGKTVRDNNRNISKLKKESQGEVFGETKLTTDQLYDQYYKEFIAKKYSVPEARRRAKLKMSENIEKKIAAKSGEKQQVLQEEGGDIFKEKKAFKKSVNAYMKGEVSLSSAILKEGGIAPHKNKDLREEYHTGVPIGLRNGSGLPLDEMADALKERYPQFGVEDTNTLLEALSKRASGGPGLASPGSGEGIEEAEVTEKDEVNKGEFKLYQRIQQLIKEYAGIWGEKYQGSKNAGVFFPQTKNIFLKTVNNLGVAAHEVLHFLDDKFGITQAVMLKKGEAKNGNPIYDSSTKVERKQLTEVYLKYYPMAKGDHPLKKRIQEGMAMLIERFVTHQEAMEAEFPDLVSMFFKARGKYYDPTVNEFVGKAQDIIRDYNKLDPLRKIGAVVMNDSRPVVKESYLNIKERLLTEIFDALYPLEKLGQVAGKKGTVGDPALWVRMYNNKNSMIINNLTSNDRGYWTIKDGTPTRLFDFNWKTVIKKLTDINSFEEFGTWLVARDTKFNYDRLDKLKEEAQQAADFLKDVQKDFEEGMIGGNIREDIKQAKDTIRHYRELASALAKNKINRDTATAAYNQHKERFNEVSEMFDKLVRADLTLLYETGMITNKHYEELTSKEGYASLKRDILNEVIGVPSDRPMGKPRVGRNKVSSMMSRHGSELTIINPLTSAMLNHAEIVAKALRQTVYNKIYELRNSAPGLFQEIKLTRAIDKEGKISYPQEKDPNILMAWFGGKRHPLIISQEIKTVLDELLTYQNIHLFEKIIIGANKMFTKGTTGLFLPFTLSNFIVDQTTAVAQTNQNLKPIFDPIKTLAAALHSKMAGFKTEDEKYLEEYLVLGGSRQTLVGWQDMTPDDLYRTLNLEKHYLGRIQDAVEKGEDIIAFLPKWSEIATRASEYIKARKAGKDVIVAMEQAGRVTAPFHHIGRLGGGSFGRTIIKGMPFFNASLQVLAQYGRTLHNPESRKRALWVLLALTAASIGSMVYLIAKGTKEQQDAYKSIPATELAGYVYFPAPDGKNLIRIRVPDQMNAIATLMNMGIADQWLNSKYTGPEFVDAATSWIPDQLNITDPARTLTAWLPQLLAPVIGVTLNKKFYPHVRPIESMGMENKPVGERYTEYTSAFAKYFGEKLNLSPVKIDFLIQGYLGRYTKFITGQKVSNPFVREMYMSGSRQIQKYYDLAEKNKFDYSAAIHKTKDYTDEERKAIFQLRAKISGVDGIMDNYRAIEKLNKDDPKLLDLREKILERIDTL